MRFTWGHAAIAIPVTIVVVFTTVLIRSMADEHKTELVTEDYYAKEMAFQEQIDQSKNAAELNSELLWASNRDYFTLSLAGDFSKENAEGTVYIYRSSDSSLDFEVTLELDSIGNQDFAFDKFKKGRYQVQISWTIDGTDCYLEKNIFIQ